MLRAYIGLARCFSGCIPESTEWWKAQSKQLFAISEDAELGLMQERVSACIIYLVLSALFCDASSLLHVQEMVTVTANDSSSEFISTVRRGPFAIPDRISDFEYGRVCITFAALTSVISTVY